MKIIEYSSTLKEHIKTLNFEWLEKYFTIEPNDVSQLEDPENEIIQKGGFIFYASLEDKIVGTICLMKIDDSTYELGKMAVTEKYQGRGVGRELLKHTIDHAKRIGGAKLVLYSNTKLIHATSLYKKFGFVPSPMDGAHYARANMKMELLLE